ncbi:MAG TPA: hypothetical protein VJJ02_05395 [Candidatus Paceibacterota bacterium]
MTEFSPEEFWDIPEGERIDALSDAFLAAGADPEVVDEGLEDDDPIEPMDV